MVTRFIFIDDAFVVNLRNIAIQIIIIVGKLSIEIGFEIIVYIGYKRLCQNKTLS